MNQARIKELLRELFWGFGETKSPFQKRVRLASRTAGGIVAIYTLFILNPQIVFSHSVTHKNYTLHALTPLPDAATEVLERADRLLRRSELFDRSEHHHVYLCNHPGWFRAYFIRPADCVYGYAYPTGQIFVSNASVERDLGWKTSSINRVRSLSGLIAHEVTHNLIRNRLGHWRTFRLPEWKNEGYAEFVAMHGQEDYERSLVSDLPADVTPNGMSDRYRGFLQRVVRTTKGQSETFSALLKVAE